MRTAYQDRILLHQKRLALGLSMKSLAKKAGRPRESVSRAVNHGMHASVLKRVREVLGV